MASQFLIYGLIDPRDKKVRYVGLSSSGIDRARQHWGPSQRIRYSGSFASWLDDLEKSELRYEIKIFEELKDRSRLGDAEKKWIAWLKETGHPLLNGTSGGEMMDDDTRELMKIRRETIGFEKMNRIIDLVASDSPCYLTDKQIAEKLGVSSRQVGKYLKRLMENGILRKEVRHIGIIGGVFTKRFLAIEETDAVSKSQVRIEEYAEPRSGSSKPDFEYPEDL